jgi:hypothetical protein
MRRINMAQTPIIAVAFAAGLCGGMLSRYISPASVQAQTQAPKEVRAQSFVVVNGSGTAFGLFGLDPDGNPVLKLIDEKGKPVWTAPPPPLVRPPQTFIVPRPRP